MNGAAERDTFPGELIPVQRLVGGWRRYDPSDVDALAKVLDMPAGAARDEAIDKLRAANLSRQNPDNR